MCGATCFDRVAFQSPLIKQSHYIEANYDVTNSCCKQLQLNNHPVTSPYKAPPIKCLKRAFDSKPLPVSQTLEVHR